MDPSYIALGILICIIFFVFILVFLGILICVDNYFYDKEEKEKNNDR